MKKFLKIFIAVILVVGAVIATCFFFFRKHRDLTTTSVSIIEVLESEEKETFNKNLYEVSKALKKEEDLRLELILTTNSKMDEIVESLSSYHIQSNGQIKNKDVANKLNEANSSRTLLNNMLEEFKIKKNSKYFDISLGANDLYKQSCVYLVKYAELANLINVNLNVDRTFDTRFNMFEVYSNTVINAMAEFKEDSKLEIIKDSENLNLVNEHIEIDYMLATTNTVGKNYVMFNKAYAGCDKQKFAKELAENIKTNASETKEQIATNYFKLIYGIK